MNGTEPRLTFWDHVVLRKLRISVIVGYSIVSRGVPSTGSPLLTLVTLLNILVSSKITDVPGAIVVRIILTSLI